MTRVVGLSGGIGSGKSSVLAMLVELGATPIDADAIVHEMQAPGTPMLAEMAAAFGDEVIREDGSLDREAVGAIVFRDEEARAQLGNIVHPPVIAEMGNRAKQAVERGDPLVVLDIPLLFEGAKHGSGSAAVMSYDATILVWVPERVQVERTVARDGCEEAEALRRIAAQMPIDEKRELADIIIDNSGDHDSTRKQVRAIYTQLTGTTEPRADQPTPRLARSDG
jgi:dephospho-CoA kinase